MTDKVQKIREEVERLMNELIQEKKKGFGSDTDDACILELQNVLTYIDFIQKEPVSEDLEKHLKKDIEDAVHGTVDFPLIGCDFPNIYPNYKELKEYCNRKGIKNNDKVKLIIIKED